MNIVLTGPMGSGKTSIGKLLAKKISYQFIDTDDLIESESKMSISEYFTHFGESSFRSKEEEIISMMAMKDNCVIATGGGVVLNPLNMRRLRLNGVIINLEASIKTLKERVSKTPKRPLLNNEKIEETLVEYAKKRSIYYKNNDISITVDNRSIEEIVEQIRNYLGIPFIRICASIAGDNPKEQIQKANCSGASFIELRLDLIPDTDIGQLLSLCALPTIVTDRKNYHNIMIAIQQQCDYVDVDVSNPKKELIISESKKYHCKVIGSMHDFEKTPKNFPIFNSDYDVIKISTMVQSRTDAYRLLDLINESTYLIVIGMGNHARYVRLVAPILGSFLTYASINIPTGPGQMNIYDMMNCYKMMGLK